MSLKHLSILCFLLTACTLTPTVGEVGKDVAATECKWLQKCAGDKAIGTSGVYKTTEECSSAFYKQFIAAANAQGIKETDHSKCTDAEWDVCLKDIEAVACTTSSTSFTLPASCSKC